MRNQNDSSKYCQGVVYYVFILTVTSEHERLVGDGNRPTEAVSNPTCPADPDLWSRLQADAEASEGKWQDDVDRQVQTVEDWASRHGRIIDPATFEQQISHSGMEHGVWLDDDTARWWKVTHPGQFGRFPFADWTIDPVSQKFRPCIILRIATPFEYVCRMGIQNGVFGDDIRIEGFVRRDTKPSLVISQHDITGKTPSLRQIDAYMKKAGFALIGDFGWYRRDDSLSAFDAQPRNFLRSNRQMLPIDLIMVKAEGELRAALEEMADAARST
jgi:hypothetical protein